MTAPRPDGLAPEELDKLHGAEILAIIRQCVEGEREECAVIADKLAAVPSHGRQAVEVALMCAARIRARGSK